MFTFILSGLTGQDQKSLDAMMTISIIFEDCSMLKKRRVHKNEQKPLRQQSPLSTLEALVSLEQQLLALIGHNHISLLHGADLFTRLEQLYLRQLQTLPIALEVLAKIIDLLGDTKAPVKARMTYLLAHQVYLKGENPLSFLQEGFYSSLNCKPKTLNGYLCGLVLSQMSVCPRVVESVLSTLVVSLEQETCFQPSGVRHLPEKCMKNSSSSLKSVYIGNRKSSHSKIKIGEYSKLHRLDLSKCLFEVYLTGSKRLQSEAKRRYYQECMQELGRRLIRQNPGMKIRQKLKTIEAGSTALKYFQSKIIPRPLMVGEETGKENSDDCQLRGEEEKQDLVESCWNKSTGFDDMRSTLKLKPKEMCSSDVFSNRTNLSFKNHFQVSKRSNSKSSSRHQSTHRKDLQRKDQSCLAESTEVKPSIILKFNRLPAKDNDGRVDIKKRKLKSSIHWQEKVNHNNVDPNVINLSFAPETKEECSIMKNKTREFGMQSINLKEEEKVLEPLKIIGEPVQGIESPRPEVIDTVDLDPQVYGQLAPPFQPEEQGSFQNMEVKVKSQKLKMEFQTLMVDSTEAMKEGSQLREGIDSMRPSDNWSEQSFQYRIVINNEEGDLIIQEQPFSIVSVVVEQYISNMLESVVHSEMKRRREAEGRRKMREEKDHQSPQSQIKQSLVAIVGVRGSEDSENKISLKSIQSEPKKSMVKIKPTYSVSLEGSALKLSDPARFFQKIVMTELIDTYLSRVFESIVEDECGRKRDTCEIRTENGGKSLSKQEKQVKRPSISEKMRGPGAESKEVQVVIDCEDGSFDDNDISSQIHSSKEQKYYDSPFTPLSKQSEKISMMSNFTCSRFGGSKIQYERESLRGSQLDMIEELMKDIDGQQMICDYEDDEAKGLKIRSRSQTDKKLGGGTTKNSKDRRESSNINYAPSLNQSDEPPIEQRCKFEHWLCPVLEIDRDRISFKIYHPTEPSQRAEKTKEVPQLLRTSIQKLNIVNEEIQKFLEYFPSLGVGWQQVVEKFTVLQLIPQVIQLITVDLMDGESSVKASFELDLYQSEVRCVLSSGESKVELLPLDMNGGLSHVLPKLQPQNLRFLNKQLLIGNIWTVVGKRNIKLRDKHQNVTYSRIFRVLQFYDPDQETFSFQIVGQSGEKMTFGGIKPSLRQKVLHNIDTIIGYAIKLAHKKVSFNTENINQLIRLL